MNEQPDHIDLALARVINAQNEGDDNVTSGDSLLTHLQAYRNNVEHEFSALDQFTSGDWDEIESGIEAKPGLFALSGPYLKLAAAALLLIILFASIILYTSEREQYAFQASDQMVSATLSDGTQVDLRPNSIIRQIVSDDGSRTYTLSGEAYLHVAPNPDAPFTLKTGLSDITVLGTRFTVSTWGSTTRVLLETGSVLVTISETGENQLMQPGELVEINRDGDWRLSPDFDPELYLGWRDRLLVFESRSFGSIAEELEFHFGIHISAPGHIYNQTLTGTINLTDKNEALEDIGLVLGGSFSREQEGAYRFKPEN